MSDISDTKPEPITAKPNWHYDSYFLSQLQRLNIRKPNITYPRQQKIKHKCDKFEVMPREDVVVQDGQLQNSKRNEIIQRINELAVSIGISVTLIENPKTTS